MNLDDNTHYSGSVDELSQPKAATSSANQEREQDLFELLVKSIKDHAVFFVKPDGEVATWNHGAQHVFGFSEAAAIGTKWHHLYSEDNLDRVFAEALKQGQWEGPIAILRADGLKRAGHMVVTPAFSDGKHEGFAVLTRDLSERHKLSESLRQADEVFRSIVSAVTDYAIFLLDPDGNVLTWNEGAQRIKGYREDEIVGKHFSIFYPKEKKEMKWPEHELEVAQKEGHYEEEAWRIRKDGTQFWASVTITPVYEEEGKLRGFIKVTRDLTERRAAEIERERAREAALEATRLKSEFVANVSHEIRTPMAGIIGMAEELILDKTLTESQREAAEQVYDSSMRLLQVLNAILDFSKLEAGKIDVDWDYIMPRKIVDDVVRTVLPYASKKGIDLRATVADNVPETITSDFTKVRQTLLNFTHNAAKFTKNGSVDINVTKQDGMIKFAVRDTGIGIAESAKKMLFQPFVQADGTTRRRFGGTGLGLSIAKKFVELMQGELGFDSEEDKGSEFWFRVPIEPKVAK